MIDLGTGVEGSQPRINVVLNWFEELAVARLARSLLYEIGPGDPTSFGLATLLLLAAALAAALRPSLRAARVDLADALRAPGGR